MPADDELVRTLHAIRERVRARHVAGTSGTGVAVPDLLPLVHARDAAEGKIAAIGTVNPRPPGPLHGAVQFIKRLIARCLDWHVREQIEFNRNIVACVNETLEAFDGVNRALAELSSLRRDAEEVRDLHAHWLESRAGLQDGLFRTEAQLFRSVAAAEAAFHQRLSVQEQRLAEMNAEIRRAETALAQEQRVAGEKRHAAWQAEWERRFWEHMSKVRTEFDRMVYTELRLIRQRAAWAPSAPPAREPQPAAAFDVDAFAERFRGSADAVRRRQSIYVPRFAGCRKVLDIGCGRGEFLSLLNEAGVPAYGIDTNAGSVAQCRAQGLQAEQADLFDHLRGLGDASLDGIFCAQVVEHLPPAQLPEFIALAASRLAVNGLLLVETPDPQCLAIFATHFYLDPSHTRPVPSQLLAFYMEESGLGLIQVERLSPALESMPAVAELPREFRETFFDGLDYAISGRKLS